MTDLRERPRVAGWLFLFLFLFLFPLIGVIGSWLGGFVAWVDGATLSLFLALPLLAIRRLERGGQRRFMAIKAISLGVAFGLAAGVALVLFYAVYTPSKFELPLLASRPGLLWLPALYGFCVHAAIAFGKEKRLNVIELCGAIYLAFGVCCVFKFWPIFLDKIGGATLLAFVNMFLFSILWTGAALALAFDVLRPAPIFKSRTKARVVGTIVILLLLLAAGIGALRTFISFSVAFSPPKERNEDQAQKKSLSAKEKLKIHQTRKTGSDD